MKARISKATREAAIDLLLAGADGEGADEGVGRDTEAIGDERPDAVVLGDGALQALWWSAYGHDHSLAEDLLEAAALLRDGWCPGDPVHLLPRKER